MGWVANATPRPLYPRERPGTHCTGGWVDPRSGLHECGKSFPHRDSIPGPSSSVASRYANYPILAHIIIIIIIIIIIGVSSSNTIM